MNTKIIQKIEEVKELTRKRIKEIEESEKNINYKQEINSDFPPISKIYGNYNLETGTYKVRNSWIEPDKNSGVLKDGSYIKNPSAINLKEFIIINDKLHWPLNTTKENKIVKENLKFVIDKNGNLILGLPEPLGKDGLQYFHPTLIGGVNPEVITAGEIDMVDGKAVLITNISGHFKPYSTTKIIIELAFENVPKSFGYFMFKFVD